VSDLYIEEVKKKFSNIDVVDYVATFPVQEGLNKLNPLDVPEQLLVFLSGDNNIIVIKVNRMGKMLEPTMLENVTIKRVNSWLKKKFEILHSTQYDGIYSIGYKYKHGKFANKDAFLSALVREI